MVDSFVDVARTRGWFTVEEASVYTGYSVATLYQYRSAGWGFMGASYSVGRFVRVPFDAVQSFVSAR